jgi:Flp pilus assembly protein TadG
MKLHCSLHRTHGQSVVLAALAMVVLVATAGLGLDGANAFNQRRNAANAADAAAMAATNILVQQQRKSPVGTQNAVYDVVAAYLNDHGIDATSADNPWTAYYVDGSGQQLASPPAVADDTSAVPSNARGIMVNLQSTFNTYFMPVLGRSQLTVGGTATAIAGVPVSIQRSDLIPLAVPVDAVTQLMNDPSHSYDFGISTGNDTYTPGNFGSVNFTSPASNGNGNDCTSGNVSNTQSYWWCNGSQYPITLGQELDGNTGNLPGLKSDIDTRISAHPQGIMPVFDVVSNPGSNAVYRIIGFLSVTLIAEDMTGNPKTITVQYSNYATSVEGAINGSVDPSNSSVFAVNLIK